MLINRTFLACTVLFIFLVNGISTMAQDCSSFMISDEYSSSSDYASYEKVKKVFCENDVADSNNARSAGAKAGIPIPVMDDVLNLSFQGTYSSTDWSHWSSSFCKSDYYQTSSQLRQSSISKVFGDNARRVVESCLNREPVFSLATIPKDGKSFSLKISVKGTEKLKSAIVTPADAVSNCDPSNPFHLSLLDRYITDMTISGKDAAFSCSWDSTKTVHIFLRLANQGDRDFIVESLPKLKPPPPPPPPPTFHIEQVVETYPSGVVVGWGTNFSPVGTVCTPPKTPDWKSVRVIDFHLLGDRACGAWSTCSGSEGDLPTRACRNFTVQGYNDGKNGGRAYGSGVLTVVWDHEVENKPLAANK